METQMEKVSYIIGRQIGADFLKQKLDINTDLFKDGVESAMRGENSSLSPQDTQKTMEDFQMHMQMEMEKAAGEQAQAGADFLEDYKKQDGVTVTASGLQYKVLETGSGATPTLNSSVEVHYEGKLIDGTIFDSSYARGETISFPVNGVISGWTEALQLMREGDVWELAIPSVLGYGARGAGAQIPPHATLIFKVELIKVK